MFNNKQQKYDILKLFSVGEQQFARVRFATSRHEDNIPLDTVKSGDFEDLSIIAPKTSEEDVEAIAMAVADGEIEVVETIENIIIATNGKGKEFAVTESSLEEFCSANGLDIEAVQAVIEGKQKSHRKWRFKLA